jgi:hypothetical protein
MMVGWHRGCRVMRRLDVYESALSTMRMRGRGVARGRGGD